MGQSYIIANLDKREFLDPAVFFQGEKMKEFSGNSEGIMQAVAVMTAVGNGNGMGDIYRVGYDTDPDTFEARCGERILDTVLSDYDHRNQRLPENQTCLRRTFVPAVTGRWAGNRILTIGDTVGLEECKACFTAEEQKVMRERSGFGFPPAVYPFVTRNYADMSEIARHQLQQFGCCNVLTVAKLEYGITRSLAYRLVNEYLYKMRTDIGMRQKYVFDLSWLGYGDFIDILHNARTPADLKLVKAWLRKQSLTTWQRSVVASYGSWGSAGNYELMPAGLPNCAPQLLPATKYLQAALDLEQRETAGTKAAATNPVTLRLGNIQPPRVNSRIITLQ